MNRLRNALAGALLLQTALVVALWSPTYNDEATLTGQVLFAFNPDSISRVVIEGDKGHTVTLLRSAQQWSLADEENTPALGKRVMGLLNKLEKIPASWPIATTAAASERFELAETNFQRHISLYQGDTLAIELYLGTSPDYRKVHARLAGSDEIYSIALNSFDIHATPGYWELPPAEDTPEQLLEDDKPESTVEDDTPESTVEDDTETLSQ